MRRFLIYIFSMLCYENLSKSQVYIYFLHESFFYFLKVIYESDVISKKTFTFHSVFSATVSYCLLYSNYLFYGKNTQLCSLSLTLKRGGVCGQGRSPLSMFTFGNNTVLN